ncbi:MAG: TetR/AcrR family transcriptional regulator [Thermoleophilaceae bacterium]
MKVNRRSQSDRSAATRGSLIDAARPLFAEQGFGAVGTEAIVRAAGVTRGALYHHFGDKTELFAAVFDRVELDLSASIEEAVAAGGSSDVIEVMKLGCNAWLDASVLPEVQQIVLIDGPAVLGWERWREIGMRYGMGLVEGMLGHAMEVGRVRRQPLSALSHVMVGALDEAALYIARAEDPRTARDEMQQVIALLIEGLAAPPG